MTGGVGGGWAVQRRRGTCAELHAGSAAVVEDGGVIGRQVRVLDATDRAVVLGRGQPASDVDEQAAAAAGMSVVRRHSGGGAVLVGPTELRWVDVVVPAGDPLWDADVGRAFWWLGRRWAEALRTIGVADPMVWHGPLRRTAWSAQVCFAGLGPGEVTVGGHKVVGLAQRRTARGALFQCAVLARWRPADLIDVLVQPAEGPGRAVEALAPAALGVGPAAADACVSALLAGFDRPPGGPPGPG